MSPHQARRLGMEIWTKGDQRSALVQPPNPMDIDGVDLGLRFISTRPRPGNTRHVITKCWYSERRQLLIYVWYTYPGVQQGPVRFTVDRSRSRHQSFSKDRQKGPRQRALRES